MQKCKPLSQVVHLEADYCRNKRKYITKLKQRLQKKKKFKQEKGLLDNPETEMTMFLSYYNKAKNLPLCILFQSPRVPQHQ